MRVRLQVAWIEYLIDNNSRASQRSSLEFGLIIQRCSRLVVTAKFNPLPGCRRRRGIYVVGILRGLNKYRTGFFS